jgi:hypothetical protein
MIDWLSERRTNLISLALALVLAIFAAPVMFVLWMTAVPGKSWSGPLPKLTTTELDLSARLRTRVSAIGDKPHNVGHPRELEAAAAYLEGALTGYGYKPVRQPFDDGHVRNVEVTIEPASPSAQTLVIGAHYDSAFNAPGANDNGSGAAAVVELAGMLADLRGKAAMRIRLVLFVNEEPPFFKTGRMGSAVYAARLAQAKEHVAAMLSLETMGYYSDRPGSQHYPFPLSMLYPDTGNFIAFVGTLNSRALVRSTTKSFREQAQFPSVGGAAPDWVQGIDWSDHWAFEQAGIPALMVTDTAPFRYPWYHDVKDMPDKIDYDRLARVVAGLERVIRNWH